MIAARAFATSLLAFTFVVAAPARADDPDVSLSFEDPDDTTPGVLDDQPINAQFKVFIDYNLPLGLYQDVVLTLPLPDRATFPVTEFITESASGSFVHSMTSDGLIEVHRWTAAALGSAVSGRLTVTLRFDSRQAYNVDVPPPVYSVAREFFTLDGTVFPFTATLAGKRALAQEGPFVDFTSAGTATRKATGTAVPQLYNAGNGYETSGTVMIDGVAGHLERHHYRTIVTGNAGLRAYDWSTSEGGAPWTITLGPDVHFVRAWVGYQSGDYPSAVWPLSTQANPTVSVLSAPIPYGQPGHTAGGVVSARSDRHLTPYWFSIAYSDDFFVDVFLPCDGAAALRPDHPTTLAAHRNTMLVGAGAQAVWDDPLVAGAPADIPRSPSPDTATPYLPPVGACGTGGFIAKSWGGTAAANNWIAWDIALGPPIGVPVITDALVIDLLPAGTDTLLVYPTGRAAQVDFLTYFCDLPGVDYFTASAFVGYLGNECLATAVEVNGYSVPPATMPEPTHLVFYAAPWGGGTASPRMATFTPYTHVRADYTSAVYGSAYMDQVQFQGSFAGNELGNALKEEPSVPIANVDHYETYAIRTVTDWSCGGIGAYPGYQPTLRELSPGRCSFVELAPLARSGYQQPRNATFDIDVPAGVIITGVPALLPSEPAPVDGVWAAGTCIDPTGEIVEPLPTDRPLHFALGTVSNPCEYHSVGIPLRIRFCLDPDFAWRDGQSLDFTGHFVESANEGTNAQCPRDESIPIMSTVSFTVAVPPELEYLVNPSCRPEGGASFTAEAANSGGQDLTGVVLTMQIPRVASGSGADATLDGVDAITNAPGGAIVQVAAEDPPVTWVALSAMAGASMTNADVRWVRLVDPNAPGLVIPALVGAPVSFRLLLATNGAAGAALVSTGRASANELAEPATASPQPFIIDSCATIRILKFHDDDGDGSQGTGEIGLPGWSFAVTATSGAVVASGVTDGSGELGLYLPGGSYQVTETIPATSGPIWAPTTPLSARSVTQSAVITVGGGDVFLPFGNDCACPADTDLCSDVPCLVTTTSAQTEASCTGPALPVCDDKVCAEAACDPAMGECTWVEPACERVDYYAVVFNAAGVAIGNIHCVLEDGQPPDCEKEQNGRLRIIPNGAPEAHTCGGGSSR